MQKTIDSIKESLLERFKNPLIGTFVLVWLVTNIKIIAEMIFSDNQRRILLVNSLTFDLVSDLAIPVFFCVIYLYLIPYLNLLHEKVYELRISAIRTKNKNAHLRWFYQNQSKLNEQKIRSQEAYLNKKIEMNLENWSNERVNLNALIASHKIKESNQENNISELILQVKEFQEQYNTLKNDTDKKLKQRDDYIQFLQSFANDFYIIIERLTQSTEKFKDNSDISTNLISPIKDDLKLIKETLINTYNIDEKNLTKT